MTITSRTWQNPGHLIDALAHLSHASALEKRGGSWVEVSDCLFRALNKLQTDRVNRQDTEPSETSQFEALIAAGLNTQARVQLFESTEFLELVHFVPGIMDQNVLSRRRYVPGEPLSERLRADATVTHRKVVNAYGRWSKSRDPAEADSLIKKAAELLYIVRCNISHGEKTPYGPDRTKSRRDEDVCQVVVPVLHRLLEVLLGAPSQRLLVYGTLAPGQPNHEMLAAVAGAWQLCEIHGELTEQDDLLTFSWMPGGPTVQAQLLISPKLADEWQSLDRFEGPRYRRTLVTLRTNDGWSVANIYVADR